MAVGSPTCSYTGNPAGATGPSGQLRIADAVANMNSGGASNSGAAPLSLASSSSSYSESAGSAISPTTTPAITLGANAAAQPSEQSTIHPLNIVTVTDSIWTTVTMTTTLAESKVRRQIEDSSTTISGAIITSGSSTTVEELILNAPPNKADAGYLNPVLRRRGHDKRDFRKIGH